MGTMELLEGRQDVKHAKIMLLCVRAFIKELLVNCRSGLMGERAVINLLGEAWDIVSSPQAERAASLWAFDFSAVWPMDELKASGGEKILRWLEHRFA